MAEQPEGKPKGILERTTIQGLVVLGAIFILGAVVFVGLSITVNLPSDQRLQAWQSVATFTSGFVAGILGAYGIFKAR